MRLTAKVGSPENKRTRGCMPDLTPSTAALLLMLVSLSLASLLIWACYEAERPRPASRVEAWLLLFFRR
jgi:hypothetical protein